MKRSEYNLFRSIRSNMRKWYEKNDMSKYGSLHTIDVTYSTELKLKLDTLYREFGFYPCTVEVSDRYLTDTPKIVYIHYESVQEWEKLTTIQERTVCENALYDGFVFEKSMFRMRIDKWETETETDSETETEKSDDIVIMTTVEIDDMTVIETGFETEFETVSVMQVQ